MKFQRVSYSSFKELEGKFNVLVLMAFNDKEVISIQSLSNAIDEYPISSKEKLHLAISAMMTLHYLEKNQS